jgi:hypothetical protein
VGAQAMSVADLRSVALAAGMDAAEGPGPPGLLSALNVFHRKSVLYGAFVWAHRVRNDRKRRFPARAGSGQGAGLGAALPGGRGGRGEDRVISGCHFAVQLNHFIPVCLSYSVAFFLK